MKKKTVEVLVTYKFKVKYEHEDHLKSIKKELNTHPINNMCGSGVASDGEFYGYSCKLIKAVKTDEPLAKNKAA